MDKASRTGRRVVKCYEGRWLKSGRVSERLVAVGAVHGRGLGESQPLSGIREWRASQQS